MMSPVLDNKKIPFPCSYTQEQEEIVFNQVILVLGFLLQQFDFVVTYLTKNERLLYVLRISRNAICFVCQYNPKVIASLFGD